METIGVYMIGIPAILLAILLVLFTCISTLKVFVGMLFESIEEKDITKFFFHLFLVLIIASVFIGIILIFIPTIS